MRRTASEVIRNLERRIARLEKQSRNKTLFEKASKKQRLQVYEMICTLLNLRKPKVISEDEGFENYPGDEMYYSLDCRLVYTTPITQICEEASKIFRQKISREDILPFLKERTIGDWIYDEFLVNSETLEEMNKGRYLKTFYFPWEFSFVDYEKTLRLGTGYQIDDYYITNKEGWTIELYHPRVEGDDFKITCDAGFSITIHRDD